MSVTSHVPSAAPPAPAAPASPEAPAAAAAPQAPETAAAPETQAPAAPETTQAAKTTKKKTSKKKASAKKAEANAKPATVVVQLCNPYPLANPYTMFKHRPGRPARVELDGWTQAQLDANVLEEAEL